MMSFISFIVNQVLKQSVSPKIENNNIVIEINGIVYVETLFSVNSEFSLEDIAFLNKIVDDIEIGNEINYDLISKNASIFRFWYLFTHEKYMIKNIVLDKYGRVGFENVSEPFKRILTVPISDILSEAIRRHFLIFTKSEIKLYFTCDYDHLNIWDVWGLKHFTREVLVSLKNQKYRKSVYTFYSFFLSRYLTRFNRYLNTTAFVENKKAENIAFFISKSLNTTFDGLINYSDKPVRSFINELKQKNVKFGLHTSFNTMVDSNSITDQMNQMNFLFQKVPIYNRHHYLRFKFPKYLGVLEKVKIKTDFSLYFPESLVFRCGTSSPFFVWNKEKQKPFEIEVIPTTLMDGTFSDYLMTDYQQSLYYCKKKLDLSIRYGSTIVLLWHNSCLNEFYRQNNFHPKLYKEIIAYLKEKFILD